MNPEALNGAASAASIAGFAGLFLPSLDKAWDSDPTDEQIARQLDTGMKVYLGLALGVGGLHSLATRSVLPIIAAAAVAGVVIATYSHAFDSDTVRKATDDRTA